jgi:Fe2+ transport system protein FeoA
MSPLTLSHLNLFPVQIEIQALVGDALTCDRLRELGLYPGEKIEVMGRAPFKGPYFLRYKATHLALREEESLCLQVKKV